eukprot:9492436-Pyramimonas_sp.AAC.1
MGSWSALLGCLLRSALYCSQSGRSKNGPNSDTISSTSAHERPLAAESCSSSSAMLAGAARRHAPPRCPRFEPKWRRVGCC